MLCAILIVIVFWAKSFLPGRAFAQTEYKAAAVIGFFEDKNSYRPALMEYLSSPIMAKARSCSLAKVLNARTKSSISCSSRQTNRIFAFVRSVLMVSSAAKKAAEEILGKRIFFIAIYKCKAPF